MWTFRGKLLLAKLRKATVTSDTCTHSTHGYSKGEAKNPNAESIPKRRRFEVRPQLYCTRRRRYMLAPGRRALRARDFCVAGVLVLPACRLLGAVRAPKSPRRSHVHLTCHSQSASSAPALFASASAAPAAPRPAASTSSTELDDAPAPLTKILCLLEPEVSVDLGGLPLCPCASLAFP